MGIALSTAWNAYRYEKGSDIIGEIRSLGIDEIELSFNLTKRIVDDIIRAVRTGQVKVNSLHNYCPIPEGVSRQAALPDCYSLASDKEEERLEAVKYTKVTIAAAASLEAKAVVLHCGRVEMADHTRELAGLYNEGRISSHQAVSFKKQILKEREERSASYFERALKSLEELSAYAGRLNIKLGIENRYYLREIPSFEEIGKILDCFKGDNIYYWHDTGHAQLWEDLGFNQHEEYLDAYSSYLAGFHLHDIARCRDHKAPLKGNFDFNRLKPYIKKDCLLVLEAHHPADSIDIIRSKAYLEKIFSS